MVSRLQVRQRSTPGGLGNSLPFSGPVDLHAVTLASQDNGFDSLVAISAK